MQLKFIKIQISIFLTVILFSPLYGQENPKSIVDKSYKALRAAGFESISTLTIIDAKGMERLRKIEQISKLYDNGRTEKNLIRFLSPADVKGTGLLTFDYEEQNDDLWLYIPALRKTRRIVSNEKSKSFMGSEFSYSDITPPPLDDFQYNAIGNDNANGENCQKIEIIPNSKKIMDENGFSKKIVYIANSNNVMRKAVYYDSNDRLCKEMNVLEIKEIDTVNHKYAPIYMVIENKLNGRKSVIAVDKINFNPDISDESFTPRFLERF